jgi:pimeloyl-ACP methyl ester carboxylesterase
MVWRLGTQYERDGQVTDEVLHPPPGEFIESNGHRYHLRRLGRQGPAVIFEAGIGATSISWTLVDKRVAEFAQVFNYDRSGYGWSPANNRPKVARELMEQMRAVMNAAGAPLPRILVGHSFGGMMMRLYAGLYPQEVAGLVMVDALSPDEWFPLDLRRTIMLRRGVQLSKRGAWLARRGVVRYALNKLEKGDSKWPRMFSLLGGPAGAGVQRRIAHQIQKLPREQWGPVRAHWSRAESFETLADHLAELPASCAQAHLVQSLGDLPLIVLAAELHTPSGHQGRQAKLAKLSRRGDYRLIPGSTHWLMLDDPDSVVEAVREIALATIA